MIVVADTSPLNYLVQIHCDNLLRELYGRVFVPSTVIEELRHSGAPPEVTFWLSQLPAWIEVRTVIARRDEKLAGLDAGERDAILLAEEMHASFLLIDERDGRLAAIRRGICDHRNAGSLAGRRRP